MATKRPLVVVLGFLGAKPRYVQKYADLVKGIPLIMNKEYDPHTKKFLQRADPIISHADTVIDTPDTMNLLDVDWVEAGSERILRKVQRARDANPDRPVFYYLLSNNGAFNFAYYIHKLKTQHPQEYLWFTSSTRGLIFDSCPCEPYVDLFTRGFTSIATNSMMQLGLTKGITVYHPTISPLLSKAFARLLADPRRSSTLTSISEGLNKDFPPRAAQLYITSELDDLVFANETIDFAKKQAKRVDANLLSLTEPLPADIQTPGSPSYQRAIYDLLPHSQSETGKGSLRDLLESVEKGKIETKEKQVLDSVTHPLGQRVWLQDFKDSTHVEHVRKYPGKYKALLQAFLQHSLQVDTR